MSCLKNAWIFGDQNFSSGDHFTKESRQKATSEKLELEALSITTLAVTKLWALWQCQNNNIFVFDS